MCRSSRGYDVHAFRKKFPRKRTSQLRASRGFAPRVVGEIVGDELKSLNPSTAVKTIHIPEKFQIYRWSCVKFHCV